MDLPRPCAGVMTSLRLQGIETMTQATEYSLLNTLEDPVDMRALPRSQLPALAHEVRQYLIEGIATCGGHFAGGLGTVELAVALHYVFDTPSDRLVWDVGHQSYPHKILTGRKRRLTTIRQLDGLAPFPCRKESPYDTFGTGHSSTSISAALGMAVAAAHEGSRRQTVAVIGDGGMTAGMAFEALNHAGDLGLDLLVILNDNRMSISPNVGALHRYLTRMLTAPVCTRLRDGGMRVLERVPPVSRLALRTEEFMKGMVMPGALFEELGCSYTGPVDGHDLNTLVSLFQNLRRQRGPRLLHVITEKGRGYPAAEADPVRYHAVTPFDPAAGLASAAAPRPAAAPSYTQVFSDWLCDMAEAEPRLQAITPAMREGSGLVRFSERFPERYFDVGIAEQHALTFAAGMACDGLLPVVAIYSTFLQRAYDQLIHDIALQNLPVLLAIDRAGVVGPDGATHAGSFDLTYLRCVPNLTVMAPADANECRRMLSTGFVIDGPAAVRYPRGAGPQVELDPGLEPLELGRAELRRRGDSGVALLAFGALLAPALVAAGRLDATVVNMRFVKPLDEAMLLELAGDHELLVTLEDNVVSGGAGSAVAEFFAARGRQPALLQLGLPDAFLPHASREQLLQRCGLDAEGICRTVESACERRGARARREDPVRVVKSAKSAGLP